MIQKIEEMRRRKMEAPRKEKSKRRDKKNRSEGITSFKIRFMAGVEYRVVHLLASLDSSSR